MSDLNCSTGSEEAIAEKLQQHWQGGGHAYTRPWNNDTDKDCVHGLPGQAEFFRQLARIAISGVAQCSQEHRENIAKAIAYDLEEGAAHGARVATTPHLDNYHINGHVNLLALADAVLRAAPQPDGNAYAGRNAVVEECAKFAELCAENAGSDAGQKMALGIAANMRAVLALPSTHQRTAED